MRKPSILFPKTLRFEVNGQFCLDFVLCAKMKRSKLLQQLGFTAVLKTKRQTKRFMLNQ